MSLDLPTARRLVLKYLASQATRFRGDIGKIEGGVGELSAKETGRWRQGLDSDGKMYLSSSAEIGDYSIIHEVVWNLISQRVLTPGLNDSNPAWPWLRLTDYGTEVVRELHWSPYDPEGYLKELSAQAPILASHYGMYAEEALQCFRAGCYLASLVMLGAASEGIVNELFRRFVASLKAGKVPEAQSVESKFEKEQSVYRKYRGL